MLKDLWTNPWVRLAALAAALLLTALLLYLLSSVLVPLLLAFIVAYIFDPVADALERRGLSRARAVLWIVTLILAVVITLPIILIPNMVVEANELVREARQERETRAQQTGEEPKTFIEATSDRMLQYLPLQKIVLSLGWTEDEAITSGEARELMRERVAVWIRDNAAGYVQSHAALLTNAGKWAGASLADLLRSIGGTLIGVLLFIGNFALFAVVTVYLLKDYDRIIAGGHDLVPPRHRPKTAEIMQKIDLQLRSFLRGQFVVCCCLGTMYAVGFMIAQVPFALTLALFGGLASFIPFVGIALTIIPAVVLTLVAHGLDWHILAVGATFALAQFLEGNFLTPRIVGSQVGLGPVWVILSVMVFSTLFGFVGLLMAVPSAAVLKVLVTEALAYYRASRVFADPGPVI